MDELPIARVITNYENTENINIIPITVCDDNVEEEEHRNEEQIYEVLYNNIDDDSSSILNDQGIRKLIRIFFIIFGLFLLIYIVSKSNIAK